MNRDLTKGNILKTLLVFSLPMIVGNLLQQFYNIADTLIVGQFLGRNALAAVGSAYTLMTFLTSILSGLSMGAGVLFAIYQGQREYESLKSGIVQAFGLILIITAFLYAGAYLWTDPILLFLQVPEEIYAVMREYLRIIFAGMAAVFLYNFFSCLLRALGNSITPLLFLAVSSILNIALDLLFVLKLSWGVGGAAAATVIAQYISGLGLLFYTFIRCRELRPARRHFCRNVYILREIGKLSVLTCVQQSVMNFGILMVQGLVNSFGPVTMAAFAAAVKIDSFAYMPVQDFGNAFSTFVSQNYGAGRHERIRKGFRQAAAASVLFCIFISAAVIIFAKQLMLVFVQPHETGVLDVGIHYLRIEGSFYWGIGCLFLFYGLYRAVKKPGISVVLTVISLGTRVLLAYVLAGPAGTDGIWWAIPAGWLLADGAGLYYYKKYRSEFAGGKTEHNG